MTESLNTTFIQLNTAQCKGYTLKYQDSQRVPFSLPSLVAAQESLPHGEEGRSQPWGWVVCWWQDLCTATLARQAAWYFVHLKCLKGISSITGDNNTNTLTAELEGKIQTM